MLEEVDVCPAGELVVSLAGEGEGEGAGRVGETADVPGTIEARATDADAAGAASVANGGRPAIDPLAPTWSEDLDGFWGSDLWVGVDGRGLVVLCGLSSVAGLSVGVWFCPLSVGRGFLQVRLMCPDSPQLKHRTDSVERKTR